MDLKVFRSTWGLDGPLHHELARVAAAGFDGVEVLVPPFPPIGAAEQRRTVLASGLEAIPLILSWDGNRDAYRRTIDAALEYNPRQVTSHTASDVMSDAEALDFLAFTLDLQREIGVPINHETHRGHIFHTSWQTARLLRALPDLHLVADYSHWVVVAERFLEDRADDLALANGHVAHIHARVGQPQAPQVNDPRSPTNADAVAVFEGWWKDIFRRRAASGAERITVTPEYGPPPYLPVLPFTDEPVADLWEVCLWGAEQVRRLFAEAMTDG
jgi:sugar phosphate isomerase/epimerase